MVEEKLVPKLRFNDFEDDWEIKKLSDVADFLRGKTYNKRDLSEKGVILLQAKNIQNNKLLFGEIKNEFVNPDCKNKIILKRNDILICRINGSEELVGKSAVYNGDYEGNVTAGDFALILRNSEPLLKWLLQTEEYKWNLHRINTGTNIYNIKADDVKKIAFLYPSIAEQNKISDFLSLIDHKLELMEKKYQYYQDFKKYLMQQIFAQKLRFDFDDEWKEYSLKDLGTTYGGLSGMSKEDFNKGNSTFIPYKSVFDNNIIDTNLLEPVELNNKKQNKVQKGDLFFTGSSETPEEVGMAAVLTQELSNCYLNSFCFGYRLNETSNIDSIFLSYYLRSPLLRNKIKILAQGSTRFNISKKELMKLKMDIPNLTEQKQIVNLFTGLDLKLSNLENQHSEMTEFKKGLLQQMLI